MSLDIPAANLLDEVVKRGLVPVSIFALCSVLSTTTLLSWITYRLVWRHDYRSQYIILIYNLLLGDLQQSLSFLISIHWLTLGRIDSPSVTCFAQGWLIQIGDMSSGFFVLAIALHTWYSVVMGRKISHAAFTSGILGIWTFAILLTFLGPAIHGPHYFVRAGAWVSSASSKNIYSPSIRNLHADLFRNSAGPAPNTTSNVSGCITCGSLPSKSAHSPYIPTSSFTYGNVSAPFAR